MKRIRTSVQAMDNNRWKASLEGTHWWAVGDTEQEAIGALIKTCREEFDIEIVDDGRNPPYRKETP